MCPKYGLALAVPSQGSACNAKCISSGGFGPALATLLDPPFSYFTKGRLDTMNTKFLVSLGSTLAATRLAQTISHLEADDMLRVVGLARRRTYFFENLALVGIGAIVGAGTAILLAPASGMETRERMASQLGKVKDRTVDALRDVRQKAPNMLQNMKDATKNEVMSSSYNNT
jgi:hypothetical protein